MSNTLSSNPQPTNKKVLYIVGYARSGTTILGKVLNEVDGFFFVGELNKFWRAYNRGRCGCGVHPSNCEFWQRTFEIWLNKTEHLHHLILGDVDREDVDHILERIQALQVEALKLSSYLRYALARNTSANISPTALYKEIMDHLYGAIFESTKARVLVDSSKGTRNFLLSTSTSSHEAYYLHIVRNPKGTTSSRQRSRERRLAGGRHPNPRVAQHSTMMMAHDSVDWTLNNCTVAAALPRLAPGRYAHINYEHFTADPNAVLHKIESLVHESLESDLVEEGKVSLDSNHIVHGNRNRLEAGQIEIRRDERWHQHLSRSEQAMIGLLTWPLRKKYGY